MLDLTKGKGDHPLYGSPSSVALPQGHSGDALYSSSIPWPLLDKFVELEHPESLDWVVGSNEKDVAMFRIFLRDTIAASTVAKGHGVSASNRDLGYFLIHHLFCCIEGLIERCSSIPSYEDSTAKMLRGLFGQLFSLMASGVQPLSMAWSMVKPKGSMSVPKPEEWWMYQRVITSFAYTGWDTENVFSNARLILSKSVRRMIVDPVTAPMRASVAEMEKAKMQNCLNQTQLELNFCRLACEVILFHFNELKENPEIAKRILAFVPETKAAQFCVKIERYFGLIANGTVRWDNNYCRMIALNRYTKRSGCFTEIKNSILKKTATVKDLKEKADSLKKLAEVDEVHIQNLDAYAKEKEMAMKGDAELKRIPWTVVTSLRVSDEEYAANLHQVLHGTDGVTDGGTDGETKKATESGPIEIKDDLILAIENVMGNSAALALVGSIEDGTFDYKVTLKDVLVEFETIFKVVSKSELSIDQIIKKQIREFLILWKNSGGDSLCSKLLGKK